MLPDTPTSNAREKLTQEGFNDLLIAGETVFKGFHFTECVTFPSAQDLRKQSKGLDLDFDTRHKALYFRRCRFDGGQLTISDTEIEKLTIIDCVFSSPAGKSFTIDLQELKAKSLRLHIGEHKTEEHFRHVVKAERCDIERGVYVQRKGGERAQGLDTLIFEQAFIGRDLVVDDWGAKGDEGILVRASRARINGDFLVEGTDGDWFTPLALNAANLRLGEELMLRNIQFYKYNPRSDILALCLRGCHVSRFTLGGTTDSYSAPALTLPVADNTSDLGFSPRDSNLKQEPGLQDFVPGRVYRSRYDGQPPIKFWKTFVAAMDPLKTRPDKTVEAKLTEQEQEILRDERTTVLSHIAAGLENAGAYSTANKMRIEEKETELFFNAPKAEKPGGTGLKVGFFVILLSLLPIWHLEGHAITFAQHWPGFLLSLFCIFGLAFIIFAPSKREKSADWAIRLFRKITFWTVREGLRPLNAIGWLIGTWALATTVFTVSMIYGWMAPEIRSYPSEWQLAMWAEMDRNDTDESKVTDTAFFANWEGIGTKNKDGATGKDSWHDGHRVMAEKYTGVTTLALYRACRHNWARPDLIHQSAWKSEIDATFKATIAKNKLLSSDTEKHGDRKHYQKFLADDLNKSSICERFLSAEYSMFSPAIYALDITLPLLNLRQEEEWSIRVTEPHTGRTQWGPRILTFIEVMFVVSGWLFALVMAGALTGLSDPNRRR